MKGLRTMKRETTNRRTTIRRTVVLAILVLFLAVTLIPALAGNTPAVAAAAPQKVVLLMAIGAGDRVEYQKEAVAEISSELRGIWALSDAMKARGYAGLDPWVIYFAETKEDFNTLLHINGDSNAVLQLPANRVWAGDVFLNIGYIGTSKHKPFFNINGDTMWVKDIYGGAKMEIATGHERTIRSAAVEYYTSEKILSYPFAAINLKGCDTSGSGYAGAPATPSDAYNNAMVYGDFTYEEFLPESRDFIYIADINGVSGPWTSDFQVFEENISLYDYSMPFNSMGPYGGISYDDPEFNYTMDPRETWGGPVIPTDQLNPSALYNWGRFTLCKYSYGSMTGRQFWGLNPSGQDPVTPTDPGTFLQPGANLGNFQEWILLSNPNAQAAQVTLSVYNQYGKVGDIPRTVPAGGRDSVCVNEYMNGQNLADPGARSVSVRVSSDVPIVAERAQYFGNALGGSLDGGSCASGQEGMKSLYFFADGCGAWGWSTFYCVYNPGNVGDAAVDFTFAGEDGGTWKEEYLVKANSRFTLAGKKDANYAVKIESSTPVSVERAMYHPNGGGAEVGTVAPSTAWRFAEGYAPQDSSWRTFVLVQNTSNSVSSLAIETLPTAGGVPVKHSINLPPRARYTYEVPSGTGDFGVQVSGSQPLIAEMTLMTASGISQIAGVPGEIGFPRKVLFAEGSNYGWPNGFSTYVLLTNFSKTQDGRVQVRYLMQGEAPITQEWTVEKGARLTIGTGDYAELQGKSFGVEVSVLSGDILATRSMVFVYNGWIRGISGNNAVSEEDVEIEQFFAEGYTGN